ncbi:conserved hypothetical protein [Paecilomyces variotii No. 5]|uniref:Protein kinase n=1 Tax=Byssochlamys spectabilis (strain No. 5 / NBRC 109023) TaxID=1356009 RepID=V5GAC0_BYSSN|nr:conserved hypothetical protein [Paecilomyces variotii No. 5]
MTANMSTSHSALNGRPNHWYGAGAAEFDLRSDTMTKPTLSMLDAITQTTLLDDVFKEDPVTNSLEEYIAQRTGHQAGLLVMSGTMGNQVAIRTHLVQPPYSILCDHRSHIIRYEAGGVSAWTGATVYGIIPDNGIHLTLEDIQKQAIVDDDIHYCPTKLISLENTLDGMVLPLDELRRIVQWAHGKGIKVHLDGARLWEAVVSGAGSLSDYASLVDSVSLCFSKGLGAPIGSIIVGSNEFIKRANWFRKSIGGGTRQAGIISAAARVAVEETFGPGANGEGGKLKDTHAKAKKVADAWTSRGGKLQKPAQTNMVWLDLEASGLGPNDLAIIGNQKGLKLSGGRIVVHYQVSDEAISRLEEVFDIAFSGKFERSEDQTKPYGTKHFDTLLFYASICARSSIHNYPERNDYCSLRIFMEATQESTQPYADPRRIGYNNSGLHEQDVSDIICILHPNSRAAHDAVAATADLAPQHILQRDDLEYETSDIAARDIALRLSSPVRDPAAGFCFGRNSNRCDVVLSADDSAKRISNVHFRIYLTDDGIIMLQDTSTNGTVVDNCRLRKNQKDCSRMLTNGSVIQVVMGTQSADEVKFVLRVPPRDGYTVQYTENLIRYLQRAQKHRPDLRRPKMRDLPTQSALSWTVGNPYGMHWTGGSLYNVTGQIGKGAFATVYKLATKQHGIVYAAKELDKRRFMKNGVLDQKVDNEMKIMKDLRHPNIVQYEGYHEHDRWIYIIMEYVAGGELSTYLQMQGKIPEDMVRSIARQVLHALQYLHKRKITHRDIKPDNILIASLDPLKVKLSDFGLSKVAQEETFLKTFCGTLLYCAPEVYPEYDTYRRGEARKRRRVGDPPPKTSPYDQSVDMWSLGAVLYHILCGAPPYIGRADDRGAQMLRTIMTTEADLDLLRREGISEEGVAFVARLLNRDPQLRPKESECFEHPWIANVPDVDEYPDDEALADDFEELPVIGEAEEELDASQLSLYDKVSAEEQHNTPEEQQAKRQRVDEEIPVEIRYPSLPNIESFRPSELHAQRTTSHLFGEIRGSIAHSAGAPEFDLKELEGDDFSVINFMSSSSESRSDHQSQASEVSLPMPKFAGSAASLLGTEALVGQLKMESAVGVDRGSATPNALASTAPVTRALTPANECSSESSKQDENVNETTPKAVPFSRRIVLPLPETSSEGSKAGNSRDHHVYSGRHVKNELDDELAVTIDAKTGKEILSELPATTAGSERSSMEDPYNSRALSHSTFVKPGPLLGKLTSVEGSIFDLTIRLQDRMTSWGRGPQATICYPDPMDTRIPAYALEITFWAPAIENRIKAGEDWMLVPDVMAVLSTKTRKCIWVNDVELRRGPESDSGREGFNFGKLYTGDIITVYKHHDRYLKFRCEFYHGDSARTRPDTEKGFIVRKVLTPRGANQLPQPNADKKKATE